MNRQEVLYIINEIIEEEHGSAVTEDSTLIECGIDSFGYALLFVGLEGQVEEKTGIRVFDKDTLKDINPNSLKVSELLDMVEEKLCM